MFWLFQIFIVFFALLIPFVVFVFGADWHSDDDDRVVGWCRWYRCCYLVAVVGDDDDGNEDDDDGIGGIGSGCGDSVIAARFCSGD